MLFLLLHTIREESAYFSRTFIFCKALTHTHCTGMNTTHVELLTPASIHQSSGDGGGGDTALPQVRLLLDGRQLMGSVTLRAALLEYSRQVAAAAVVVVDDDWRASGGEAELFRWRGHLTQGQRQAARGGVLLFAAQRSEGGKKTNGQFQGFYARTERKNKHSV